MRPIDKQTILITGATDGLGRGVAEELARRGVHVIVHGRSRERADQVVAAIRGAGGRAEPVLGDFSSLAQVRALGEELTDRLDRLDGLVNNAGIGTVAPGGGARLVSQDGIELRFALNYLAAYLLTHCLVGMLIRSAPARIVNVASVGQAPIDFADPQLTRGYTGRRAYSQSKLALIMLAFDLAERLAGRGVTANALHPATLMPTKIVLDAYGSSMDSLETGVRATVRLAADPALVDVTGRYFDRQNEDRADPQAYDLAARHRLDALARELIDRAVGVPPSADPTARSRGAVATSPDLRTA